MYSQNEWEYPRSVVVQDGGGIRCHAKGIVRPVPERGGPRNTTYCRQSIYGNVVTHNLRSKLGHNASNEKVPSDASLTLMPNCVILDLRPREEISDRLVIE